MHCDKALTGQHCATDIPPNIRPLSILIARRHKSCLHCATLDPETTPIRPDVSIVFPQVNLKPLDQHLILARVFNEWSSRVPRSGNVHDIPGRTVLVPSFDRQSTNGDVILPLVVMQTNGEWLHGPLRYVS